MTDDNVRVVVRVRPMIQLEHEKGDKVVIEAEQNKDPNTQIECPNPNLKKNANAKPNKFTFDNVFHSNRSQSDLYENVVAPMLVEACEGYNVTMFAYGQTGSGKTYTMGTEREDKDRKAENLGIIPRFVGQLFDFVDNLPKDNGEGTSEEVKITCSFVEIYQNDIIDLLDNTPVQKESHKAGFKGRKSLKIVDQKSKDGVYIEGLNHTPVTTKEQVLETMYSGIDMRKTAETGMNKTSSRSHAIFTLIITRVKTSIVGEPPEEVEQSTRSRVNFVDLAGSERIGKTGATGQTKKEGIGINKGLQTLNHVLTSLSEGKNPPYRDTKLTHVLKDSLGGNSRTLMLATCSPAESNVEETAGTLRYAKLAKQIKNKAVVNRDAASEQIFKYEQQIKLLQVALVCEKFKVDLMSWDEMKSNKDYWQYITEVMGMDISPGSAAPSMFVAMAKSRKLAKEAELEGDQGEGNGDDANLLDATNVEAVIANLQAGMDVSSMLSSGKGSSSNAVSNSVLMEVLSNHRQLQHKYEVAQEKLRRAWDDRKDLLRVMMEVAKEFEETKDYDKALMMHKHALTVKKTQLGESHPATSRTLWAMADIYSRKANAQAKKGAAEEDTNGDFEEAIDCYRQAMAIQIECFGEKTFDSAMLLHNLASTYFLSKKYDDALEVYTRALDIKMQLIGGAIVKQPSGGCRITAGAVSNTTPHDLGSLSPAAIKTSAADTCMRLAAVHAALNQRVDAITLYTQAIDELKLDAKSLVEAHQAIASLVVKPLPDDVDIALAVDHGTKALSLLETAFGPNTPESMPCLEVLATAYSLLSDHSSAHAALLKLLASFDKQPVVKMSKEEMKQAIKRGLKKDDIDKEPMVKRRRDRAALLGRMGDTASKFDAVLAVEDYQKAVDIAENADMAAHQAALKLALEHSMG